MRCIILTYIVLRWTRSGSPAVYRGEAMQDKVNLFVISHTHWDREWYQSFEGFRKRLVYMMDDLLDVIEDRPGYIYFHLDGHTIMLEDYLEIRPEKRNLIEKLIKTGRLIVGPWYVMPDEFLISGELLIRNLKMGIDMASEFKGKAMDCGYVVDIFGHNSQLPQVLRKFGIQNAMLYRGMGSYKKDMFIWEAPDGSRVLTSKLDPDHSYSNFYYAVRRPFDDNEYEENEIKKCMQILLDYSLERAVSNNLLMMDGTDHIEVEPQLPMIIDSINKTIPNVRAKHTTIEEYFKAQRKYMDRLDVIYGELYSIGDRGIHNRVLKNVLSSMVHIKQLNNKCETELTVWAEPYAAIADFISLQNQKGFFKKAFKTLMQNHPHDSICGCSKTCVHQDNIYRFNQVLDITKEIEDHNFNVIAKNINTHKDGMDMAFVVFSGNKQALTETVEAELCLPSEFTENFKIYDTEGNEVVYQILYKDSDQIDLKNEMRRLPKFKRVKKIGIAFNANVPAVGYSTYWIKALSILPPRPQDYTFSTFNPVVRYRGTMRTGQMCMENDLIKVYASTGGTLEVTYKATNKKYCNLLTLEDSGDTGDGWLYIKPVSDAVHYSSLCGADIAFVNDGPCVCTMKITVHMFIPDGFKSDETARLKSSAQMDVVSYVTMRKNSARLDIRTTVENSVVGHRLRVMFPTFINTDKYFAATPFALNERKVGFGDTSGHIEEETFVSPVQGLVIMREERCAVGIYNKGLYETGVSEDESRTIALTLFRSFISEVPHKRKADMGHMLFEMSFDYAVEFFDAYTSSGEIFEKCMQYRNGLKCRTLDKLCEGLLPASDSYVSIEGSNVMLSCYKKADSDDSMHVLRVFNIEDKETVRVKFKHNITSVWRLDLREQKIKALKPHGRELTVVLSKAEIATIGVKFSV